MNTIYDWMRKAFDFSQTEVRGFIVLIFCMFSFIAAPCLLDIYCDQGYTGKAKDKQMLDSLVSVLQRLEEDVPIQKKKKDKVIQSNISLIDFDPNTASSETLVKIGLPLKLARTIVNYRNKGGKFRCKKDLAKIYGMPVNLFKSVEKYITLPDSVGTYAHQIRKPKEIVKRDINLTDTADLEALKGIGSKLSIRIIKYRNALGGFVFNGQWNEVYGLDSFAISQIDQNFFTGNENIIRLNINHAALEQLATHPYIGRKYANILINYRKNHEPFKTLDDIKKVVAIPVQNWEKLAPYLEY